MTHAYYFSKSSRNTVLDFLNYGQNFTLWLSPTGKNICLQSSAESALTGLTLIFRVHSNPRGHTFVVVKNPSAKSHNVAMGQKTGIVFSNGANALQELECAMNALLDKTLPAPSGHTTRYSDVILSKGYHVPDGGFILGGHAKASLNYLENQFRNEYHNVGLSVNYGVVYATLDIARAGQDNRFALCNEEDFFSNAPKGLHLTDWGQHLLFGCTRGQTLIESVETGLNCRVPITLSNPAAEQMKYALHASSFSLPPGTLFSPAPPPAALTPLEMAQCIAELQAENAMLKDRVRLLTLAVTHPAKAQPNALECLDQLREMCVKLMNENASAPVSATSGYVSPQRDAMFTESLHRVMPYRPKQGK